MWYSKARAAMASAITARDGSTDGTAGARIVWVWFPPAFLARERAASARRIVRMRLSPGIVSTTPAESDRAIVPSGPSTCAQDARRRMRSLISDVARRSTPVAQIRNRPPSSRSRHPPGGTERRSTSSTTPSRRSPISKSCRRLTPDRSSRSKSATVVPRGSAVSDGDAGEGMSRAARAGRRSSQPAEAPSSKVTVIRIASAMSTSPRVLTAARMSGDGQRRYRYVNTVGGERYVKSLSGPPELPAACRHRDSPARRPRARPARDR